MVNLERMPVRRRKAIAKSLIAGQGQTVGRHLVDGDMVVMNRQVTTIHLLNYYTYLSHF